MNVILAVVRQVVIEDDFHVVHVQPARRHVRRHEQLALALAEPAHHALAHRLAQVAVQRLGPVATRARGGWSVRRPSPWSRRKRCPAARPPGRATGRALPASSGVPPRNTPARWRAPSAPATRCGRSRRRACNGWIRSRMGGGTVAEKKTVCRSGGAWERIVSMSSRKPMSSIRSASSSTTVRHPSARACRARDGP